MPGFLEDHGGWRHQVPASSSFESTIWLWHSQFAMENHHCLQVNHGKPSISIRAIDKPWLCWSLPDDTKNLEIFAGTTRGVHSQKALMAEKFHPVDSVDYPYMLHGARIFTYKTGWFLGQMLGFIFQHHGAYGYRHKYHIFHFIYGMSSFPLTNSYFSRLFFNHQPDMVITNWWNMFFFAPIDSG